MRTRKLLILAVLLALQSGYLIARADVLEVTGGVDFGHFMEGLNLTQNKASTSIAGEWSASNGGFAALSCFTSENGIRVAIQRGCVGRLGWFTPVNKDNAFTFEVSRHDYSSPVLAGWQYTNGSVSWHIGKDYMLKLRASDSLLGQGFSSITSSFHIAKPLTERLRVGFQAGISSLQSGAPVDDLKYGLISAQYRQGRWSTELKLMLSSSDYRRFVKLDVDDPEIGVSFRYRLY